MAVDYLQAYATENKLSWHQLQQQVAYRSIYYQSTCSICIWHKGTTTQLQHGCQFEFTYGKLSLDFWGQKHLCTVPLLSYHPSACHLLTVPLLTTPVPANRLVECFQSLHSTILNTGLMDYPWDLNWCTTAELVYGTSLLLLGEFFTESDDYSAGPRWLCYLVKEHYTDTSSHSYCQGRPNTTSVIS